MSSFLLLASPNLALAANAESFGGMMNCFEGIRRSKVIIDTARNAIREPALLSLRNFAGGTLPHFLQPTRLPLQHRFRDQLRCILRLSARNIDKSGARPSS